MKHPKYATDMTFGGAIAAVPQLGTTCSIELEDCVPGLGIKLLRLVSKQLRVAMMDIVQGYTLCLDGSGAGLVNEMGLLQDTKLSRMHVLVMDDTNGRTLRGLNSWNSYTQHLRCFIHGMGAAIKSVTHLKIDTEGMSMGQDTVEKITALLSLLAPAIPALQQLRVTGNIGRGLLSALGHSCPKFSSLEIGDGSYSQQQQSLFQLHHVIPGLTHCKVTAHPASGDWLPETAPCCLQLLSCATLTSLDVSHCTLSAEMWQALPPGLKALHCALADEPYVNLNVLSNLQHLSCHCTFSGNLVELCSLVAVLRVAPVLKTLHIVGWGTRSERSSFISEVYLTCAAATIPDLVYLNNRVTLGLEVMSTWCLGGHFRGVNLSLGLWAHTAEYGCFEEYLMLLPPLPAITGLVMASSVASQSLSSISTAVAAAFPNITALVLELFASVDTHDLTHLGKFTSLQHLSLRDAGVTHASLAMLCSRLVALKVLRLEECGQFNVMDGEIMQSLLHDWGSKTEVTIVSRVRDD